MSTEFGTELRRFRRAAGLSQGELARLVPISQATISRYESGLQTVDPATAGRLDELVGADGALARTLQRPRTLQRQSASAQHSALESHGDTELGALELARRAASSNVGSTTLAHLEATVDELASAYPATPPGELESRLRTHIDYVTNLLDARASLSEHTRLLNVGAWLSLLAATVYVDLDQQPAATAYLRTAASLASDTGHAEIIAWCYETAAWRVLTNGDYRQAVALSQSARHHAPTGSSAMIQATAQEGRSWARLGNAQETRRVLGEVHRMAECLPQPERPDHHYIYDPTKAIAYTATTLAWIADPAAEGYARTVIDRLGAENDHHRWPRRVASAHIDLGLSLLGSDRLDEAAEVTRKALESGRVAPSNYWRADEVVRAIETRGLHVAGELRETYRALCQ
ncbi:helix-turn-helix domain-containing protein [Saccharopolyspora phatthalungensis]|uniref:Transcriptional regulator with XRE-family HTH domain n=1 Tax=Saccharopolyspora phatthalungensis TaxID=664693 RepID=A0A840PW24_9PSEU|nr:helix-turn-helix transcriptional regulator [Saccharopolyspora phatthalungensis]MBB5152526.1 transcriptional regulator with XRE-family HTH domain [Saccharopolyspora phatthalungensis]